MNAAAFSITTKNSNTHELGLIRPVLKPSRATFKFWKKPMVKMATKNNFGTLQTLETRVKQLFQLLTVCSDLGTNIFGYKCTIIWPRVALSPFSVISAPKQTKFA